MFYYAPLLVTIVGAEEEKLTEYTQVYNSNGYERFFLWIEWQIIIVLNNTHSKTTPIGWCKTSKANTIIAKR